MTKKIILICPNRKNGSPANERFLSYVKFFQSENFIVEIVDYPVGIIDEVFTLFKIILSFPHFVFISQPPFRFWMLFFIPFIRIILDIRDGWSIGIKSGYGGTVKPNFKKYMLVSLIESLMIKKSILTITCTFGLKNYLEEKYNKEVVFIPNGISSKNMQLIQNIQSNTQVDNDILTFSCAGQFSEYGKNKAKKIIDVVAERYKKYNCIIQIIGANKEENAWIKDYILIYENIEYKYVDRVDQVVLYKLLKASDYALAIIRDPNYDYGTKIFEYVACELKVINYFSESNNFTNYFDGCFDINFKNHSGNIHKSIIREDAFLEFKENFERLRV